MKKKRDTKIVWLIFLCLIFVLSIIVIIIMSKPSEVRTNINDENIGLVIPKRNIGNITIKDIDFILPYQLVDDPREEGFTDGMVIQYVDLSYPEDFKAYLDLAIIKCYDINLCFEMMLNRTEEYSEYERSNINMSGHQIYKFKSYDHEAYLFSEKNYVFTMKTKYYYLSDIILNYLLNDYIKYIK